MSTRKLKESDVDYVSVAGNGACLFNSVAQNIHLENNTKSVDRQRYSYKLNMKEVDKSSMDLRQRSVDWIKSHLDIPIPPTEMTVKQDIQDSIKDGSLPNSVKSVNNYLDYMRKKSSYGGQIEICALAHILNRNINVYKSDGDNYTTSGLGYTINPNNRDNDILLFHNMNEVDAEGGHHYDLLYPISRGVIITKQQFNKLNKPITKPTIKSKYKSKSSSVSSLKPDVDLLDSSISETESSSKPSKSSSKSAKSSSKSSSKPSVKPSSKPSTKSSDKSSDVYSSIDSVIGTSSDSVDVDSDKPISKSLTISSDISDKISIKMKKPKGNCRTYKKSKPPPGCDNVDGCKWIPKIGCLENDEEVIRYEIDNKGIKLQDKKTKVKSATKEKPNPKPKSKQVSKPVKTKKVVKNKHVCRTYKKTKPSPGCDKVDGCKWIPKIGCLENDEEVIRYELRKKGIN